MLIQSVRKGEIHLIQFEKEGNTLIQSVIFLKIPRGTHSPNQKYSHESQLPLGLFFIFNLLFCTMILVYLHACTYVHMSI